MKLHLAPLATAALAIAGFTVVSDALAEDVGQHPAVFAPRALPAVNPSTFIVGHPASPKVRGGHANFEHPAVAAARAAAAIDPNTFLVQPPASVSWVEAPVVVAPIALLK
jgi:hypothetical protein